MSAEIIFGTYELSMSCMEEEEEEEPLAHLSRGDDTSATGCLARESDDVGLRWIN